MDHHTVAAISISGTCLDVLGSLYLAYDVLGGQHGPLRLLTRMVTYSIVFGVGYSLGLGLFFGLVSGLATGVTIAIELHRVSRGKPPYSLLVESIFSLIRGFAFGVGLYKLVGVRFAVAFAALVTLGQAIAYARGVRPSMDYAAARRARLSPRLFWAAIVRTGGNMLAALICSAFVRHLDHPWKFAIQLGLVVGLVTGIGSAVVPFIEYYADSLPERRLGAFGIGLILCGFAMQSLQYWLSLLDVKVT